MSDTYTYFHCKRSDNADWLVEHHPWAFLLLWLIARRARRTNGHIDGLEPGEAFIGDYEKCGIPSRKAYRHALSILVKFKLVEIKKDEKNRKSSSKKSGNWGHMSKHFGASRGTLVKILDTSIWDINYEDKGHIEATVGAYSGPIRGPKQEWNNGKIYEDKKKRLKKENFDSSTENLPEEPLEENFQTDPTQHNVYYQTSGLESTTYEKKKPHTQRKTKIAFREFIFLTQIEFDTLLAKHGKEKLEKMLDILDSYKGSTGKKYSRDYFTMKEGGWVLREVDKARPITQKISIRDKVLQKFKHGQKFGDIECYVNEEAISFFCPPMTHHQLRFNSNGFDEQFKSILKKARIPIEWAF